MINITLAFEKKFVVGFKCMQTKKAKALNLGFLILFQTKLSSTIRKHQQYLVRHLHRQLPYRIFGCVHASH